jgi:hypothetical protein
VKAYKTRIWASLLAGGLLLPGLGFAEEAANESFDAGSSSGGYFTVASLMPWYAVPDRYLFSGGYYMHLNITEMRIDHVADNSRCTKRNRNFMVAVSFAQPIGNELFSSRFELPLISGEQMSVKQLHPASPGDYVVHLSNIPLINSTLGMAVAARF